MVPYSLFLVNLAKQRPLFLNNSDIISLNSVNLEVCWCFYFWTGFWSKAHRGKHSSQMHHARTSYQDFLCGSWKHVLTRERGGGTWELYAGTGSVVWEWGSSTDPTSEFNHTWKATAAFLTFDFVWGLIWNINYVKLQAKRWLRIFPALKNESESIVG